MPPKQNSQVSGARRKKGKQQSNPVPLASFVPSAKRITMSFSTSLAIAESAAGAGNFWFYRLNSVYDPDASGVGSVAIGYNTWSTLFLSYKVRRVTVRLQGNIQGMSAGGVGNVIMAPVPYQMVVPSNKQTWRVIPRSILKTMSDYSVGGKNTFMMMATFDLWKIAGVTKAQYNTDMDFSGNVGSNPARQIYVVVTVDSVGSNTACTLVTNVQISYEVEWFNPTPMQ